MYSILDQKLITAFMAENHEVLKTLIDKFSPPIPEFWGFESDLCDHSSTADILLEAKPYTTTWNHLQEIHNKLPNSSFLSAAFLEANSSLAKVRNSWLEFDSIHLHDFSALVPSLFWGPSGSGLSNRDNALWILSNLFPQTKFDINQFSSSIQHWHENVEIMQLGYMYPRADKYLRLVLNAMTFSEMLNFLVDNNYKFMSEAFYQFKVFPPTTMYCLCLGFLGDFNIRQYAFEIYQPWNAPSNWNHLLKIVRTHFIDLHFKSNKIDCLLDLYKRKKINSIYWGKYMNLSDLIVSTIQETGLHHLKISFENLTVNSIKAYIGVITPQLRVDRFGQASLASDKFLYSNLGW